MVQDRSSQAETPLLLQDKEAIARKEAENTLRQFDLMIDELSVWLANRQYQLKPSLILKLNRAALNGLSDYAGVFRPANKKTPDWFAASQVVFFTAMFRQA